MTRWRCTMAVGVAVVALSACSSDGDSGAKKESATTTTKAPVTTVLTGEDFTSFDLLGFDQQFVGLLDLVTAAGIGPELSDAEDVTLFAPRSEAIDALGEERIAQLKSDPDGSLAPLIRRHVVAGTISFADLISGGSRELTSIDGQALPVTVNGQEVRVGGALVTKSDITSKNGVIHVLDAVIGQAG